MDEDVGVCFEGGLAMAEETPVAFWDVCYAVRPV